MSTAVPSRGLPTLPQYRKDGVTRRLCASVHLDEQFALDADRELTGDGITAMGLTLGINFVALARHARAALRRRETLDRQLAWLSVALLAAFAAVVSGLVRGIGSVALGGGYGIAGILVVSWWLVHRAESEARTAARGVFQHPDKAEKLAPPVEPEAEAWLHELKRANVLAYADAAARANPFVGSGSKIKEVVWQPIDVSRPADAPNGGKLTLRPFDAVDLHTYVAREMEGISGLDGLRAKNRLYVLGSKAHLLPDLLPDPVGRPCARIDKQWVQSGLINPGAGMRTHLCLERVGEGGRLIVSLYLRAILSGPSLTWEVAAYAIPPLGGRFYQVDRLPVASFERWWSLVSYATSHTLPELKGAIGRITARSRWRRTAEKALARQRREITDHHVIYDRGAVGSVRQGLGDWRQAGYDEEVDAQDFLFRLQQGVLVATERFLQDHNVDTSSFDKAQAVISTQTYNIGNVTGSNIGPNGQVNNNNGPQGQGPSGQGPGGPGGPQHP
ncbi:hypothetical protein [Streptomyces sp. YIM S03343]